MSNTVPYADFYGWVCLLQYYVICNFTNDDDFDEQDHDHNHDDADEQNHDDDEQAFMVGLVFSKLSRPRNRSKTIIFR